MAGQLRIQGRFGFRDIRLIKSEENSLGIGSYGAVYRAKCDQLVCAAKVLHPILFQTRDPAVYRIVERFQREIDFLSGLRHPNVIQYLGSCADPETRLPILFMELMDESLTNFLERPVDPPPLPLHVQVDIGHDVVQALSHLHRHEVLHRDLSSNNVLLIGSRRAKVTDFGMAKLLGIDPHLTPTYCPGTNCYMSPEALADPPAYTSKLDIFSFGVLLIQLITRKWPNPGPRTRTIQISDPRVPSGQVLMMVPELERRKEHLDLISPTHPLLEIALDCLKDKESQRLTTEELCSRLIALKESAAYQESLQQIQEENNSQVPPTSDQELQQQLRESDQSRVDDLTREVQQLQLENEEQARNIQQRDELFQQKHVENLTLQQQIDAQREENQHLQQENQTKTDDIQQLQQEIQTLQACRQDNEQVISSLQENVEQRDAELMAKDELLQEKQREIRKLQQGVGGREGSGVATTPLKLKWRDGPAVPYETWGCGSTVSGEVLYLRDGVSKTKMLMFNSRTKQWTNLPECPKRFSSLALVNGQPTAIGGQHLTKPATNTLLSLQQKRPGIFEKTWIEQFPPMTFPRNNAAVSTTNTSLIVAGGWGYEVKFSEVEIMDTWTLQWSIVAGLPFPLSEALATVCGNRLYIGGGFDTKLASNSVVMCEVKDLLQSQPQPLATSPGHSSSLPVWKGIASLPVNLFSLVALQGQLLAVGGSATAGLADATSEVRQYDATANSWNVISQMKVKRCRFHAGVLPDDTLIVCGGLIPGGPINSVEVASLN